MNCATALLLVLSLLVALSAASIPTEDGVFVLSNDNFDQFINDQEFTVVEFYAPWCGHCKKLAPEYAEAAQILAKELTPIKLAKVDCTQEKAVCDRFEVRGYPTIKNFIAGKASDYQGPRTADGIVRYVISKSGPASVLLTDQVAVEKYRSDTAPTIIFYGPEDSELFSAFNELAKIHREELRFGHVHDQETLAKSGHSNTVVIYQAKRIVSKLENDSIVHTGDKNDLAKFISQKSLPLAGEFTDSNKGFYKDLGIPVAKVVFNIDWKRDPKTITYHLNRIRKVAADFLGKLSFVIASPQSQTGELRDLALEGVDISFFIHDLNSDLKYRAEDAKYSPDALRAFANDFVAGKVEKYLKSEPIPDNSANDVKVVVGKNFEEIVYDTSKDVLLEAYAPWCGHCKKLAPIYEELAKKLSKNAETLTIAKIDATANTVPPEFKVQGFPSIFFVPANNKGAPIQYEGEREVDDFIAFIQEHATSPVIL
jgi:protein disulfide isomerase family A protein 3